MKREERQTMSGMAKPATTLRHSEDSEFIVRIARTEYHLEMARAIRYASFARAAPNYAPEVRKLDPMDYDNNSIVFLAESRRTGLPIASIRLESNRGEHFYPSTHFDIPDRITQFPCAHATRLAARPGRGGARAKELLLKAAYRYCLAMQLHWIIVIAVPPRDRHYQAYGVMPIPEIPELVQLPDAPKKARVMACNVFQVEQSWRESNHPYYRFLFADPSPEIQVFSSVRGAWLRPRDDQSVPQSAASDIDQRFGLHVV